MWRHGGSFGLVRCDRSSLLTCGLVCSVRFGLPGVVSYGLDLLCGLIGPGLVCLVVLSLLVCRCPYCPGQVVLIYLGRHDLVCSVLLCPSLVCSLWSALVLSRLLCSRQACLLSLISVPSCSLWCVLVWPPLLYSRLVCFGLFG